MCVIGPGMAAAACADARTAKPADAARALANFRSYIQNTKEPIDAVARYYEWLNDHRDSPELLQISPPDLWARSRSR